MNKTAKYMTSRYAGTCNKCGTRVEAGAPMLWLARGKIECNDCTGGAAFNAVMTGTDNREINTKPQHKAARGTWNIDKLNDAMDWEAATPKPAKPAKRTKTRRAATVAPTKDIPVTAPVVPTDAEKKLIDARMITAGHTPPAREVVTGRPAAAEVVAPTPEPTRDAVTALVCDQLALLVNALDNATGAQRQTIREYAEKFAADSVVPSRARIWHALATTAIS